MKALSRVESSPMRRSERMSRSCNAGFEADSREYLKAVDVRYEILVSGVSEESKCVLVLQDIKTTTFINTHLGRT